MKKIKLTFLFVISLSCHLFAQTQMIRWALPGNQLYFNPNPVVQSLPTATSYYASNATTDNSGNLLFYIVDRSLYSSTGTLCGTFNSTAILSGSSIAIVPVPEQCKHYYVILTSNSGGSLLQAQYLEYAKVNANGANPIISQQTQVILNSQSGSATGSVGFAVSRVVANTAKRFLYFVGNDLSGGNGIVSRFDITSTGISNKVAIATASTPGIVTTSPTMATEVDLSPNSSKLAWVSGNDSKLNIITLNPTTGAFVSAANATITGGTCFGVEWNATSATAYVSNYVGLSRVTASTMTVNTIASSALYNNTQLEMGRDGLVYAVKNNGTGFGVINTSHIVSNSPLVITLNGKDYSEAYYTLPNQVDGEDYLNFMKPVVNIQNTPLCVSSGTNVILNAIPSTYSNYSWYSSADGYTSVISSNFYYQETNSNISKNYKVCTTSATCGTGCSPVGNVRWCAPGYMCCIPKREGSADNQEIVVEKTAIVQPNPSNGLFEISIDDTSEEINQVNIYNITGKIIKSIKVLVKNSTIEIDAREISNGVYLVEAIGNSGKTNSKICIQK